MAARRGQPPNTYERYRVPAIFAPWAERLVEHVAPQPGERVLDIACGTGIVARYAAQRVGESGTVVGLDLNEGMLEVARAVSSSIRPPVEWINGDATDMSLPDEAFDAVFCQQALQFFPDRPAALREMHRVLVPNGRLGISVWRAITYNPGYVAAAEALERHAGSDAREAVHAIFSLSDPAELRELVTGAGFRDVHIRLGIGTVRFPSPQEYLWRFATSYPPLVEPIRALDGDVREALLSAFGEAMRAYTDDDGLVFPQEAHIAVARR